MQRWPVGPDRARRAKGRAHSEPRNVAAASNASRGAPKKLHQQAPQHGAYFIAMTFQDFNLSKFVNNALLELGYTEPTTIQQKAFPAIASGKDVVGIAQTGTGKTLAYLLPFMQRWKFSKEREPQLLIVVPTRELVVQVVEALQALAKYTSLEVVGVYGGTNIKTQAAELKKGQDAIVGTPGRLMDLMLNGSLKPKTIKTLVIDEVDEMLDLGFRQQLINLINLLPIKRQNLLFSATMTEEVDGLINDFFDTPLRIEAAPTGTPLSNIDQHLYQVPNFNTKVNLLGYLLYNSPEMRKVMVFCASRKMADLLFERLDEQFKDQLGVIHSNKAQNNRFATVRAFHEGKMRVLIATDIVARGLDVSEVSHVINFDTPEVPEHYIHRIGRTGRADKRGIALTFCTEAEQENLEGIEALMQYQVPVLPLPEDLTISDILTEDELPKVVMKHIDLAPKKPTGGLAFHEKLPKNQKTNSKVRHTDLMMLKYGKRKTRGDKRQNLKKK